MNDDHISIAAQRLAEYDFSQTKAKSLYPRLHQMAYDLAKDLGISDRDGIGVLWTAIGKALNMRPGSPYLANVLRAHVRNGTLNATFRR